MLSKYVFEEKKNTWKLSLRNILNKFILAKALDSMQIRGTVNTIFFLSIFCDIKAWCMRNCPATGNKSDMESVCLLHQMNNKQRPHISADRASQRNKKTGFKITFRVFKLHMHTTSKEEKSCNRFKITEKMSKCHPANKYRIYFIFLLFQDFFEYILCFRFEEKFL